MQRKIEKKFSITHGTHAVFEIKTKFVFIKVNEL